MIATEVTNRVEGRVFAELPFCATWLRIRQHLCSLDGASEVRFTAAETGGNGGLLSFRYDGWQFDMHNYDATLHLSVTDSACREATMLAVLHHFSELLTAHLGD